MFRSRLFKKSSFLTNCKQFTSKPMFRNSPEFVNVGKLSRVINGEFVASGELNDSFQVNGASRIGKSEIATKIRSSALFNGTLNAINTTFEKPCQVNGDTKILSSSFLSPFGVAGGLTAEDSKFDNLHLFGSSFSLTRCEVAGSINLHVPQEWYHNTVSKLTLSDTVVDGDVLFETDSDARVELILQGNSQLKGDVVGVEVVDMREQMKDDSLRMK